MKITLHSPLTLLLLLVCFSFARAAAPTVTVTPQVAGPTNAASIVFDVVFSESVTGLTNDGATDLLLSTTTGGTLAAVIGGSGTTWTVTVTGQTGTGNISLTIRAGAVINGGAEANLVSNTGVTAYDGQAPSVTSLIKKVSQADPTNASPVLYEVTFSEPVTGLLDSELTLGGTAGGTLAASITETTPGLTWEISVTGMTGTGTVTVSVPINIVQDAAGNNNTASGADASVTYDEDAPGVTSLAKKGSQPDPTASSPIVFVITFDEPITGFVAGDLTLGGTATGTLAAAITEITPNLTWEIEVTGMTGSGTVTVALDAGMVTDAAGNDNTASGTASVTYDVSAPEITFSPLNNATGVALNTNITISFNETIRNINNSAIDNSNVDALIELRLTNSGGAVVASTTTIVGNVITINPDADLSSSQLYYVSIAPVEDALGNATVLTSITFTTIDAAPPVVSGAFTPADGADPVGTDTDLIINFNENVIISATATSVANDTDILIKDGADATIQTISRGSGAISISGTQVTISINDLNLSTDYYILIGNKVFSDAANNNFAGISTTTTWNFRTGAGVTVTPAVGGACVSTFSNLGNIVITETSDNNIVGVASTSRTLVLSLSNSGYQFKPCTTCTGIVTASFAAGGDINTTSVSATSVTFSKATFNIPFEGGNAGNDPDVITISGLQVTSDDSEVSADVVKDATSTLTIQGITNGSTPLATITTGAQPSPPDYVDIGTEVLEFCEDDVVIFPTADIDLTGTTIRWYDDVGLTNQIATGGTNVLVGADLGVDETTPGTYTRYATQSAGGCESNALVVPLVVNKNPVADAGDPTRIICSDETITAGGAPTLTTASSGSSYSYAWGATGPQVLPAIATNSNPSVDFPANFTGANQVYTLTVTITDNLGCVGIDQQTVDVRPQLFAYLQKPSTYTFTPTTPAQELETTLGGGIFTGIGVVQSGPNTFKFDPATAHASNADPLPNNFDIYYTYTDVNGCTNYNNTQPIATFTISNLFFTNLLSTYCADEFPYTSPGAGGILLELSAGGDNQVVTDVNYWNTNNRQYQSKLYYAPVWDPNVTYNAKQVVKYGSEWYAAKVDIVGNFLNLDPVADAARWEPNILHATFTGTIRNAYEGYYNGNQIAPTVQEQATSYTVNAKSYKHYKFYTNSNYNDCPDCPYNEVSAFIKFTRASDIYYYINDWVDYYYYYANSLVTYNGSIYKCIKAGTYTTNEHPNLFPAVWQNVTNTSFNAGYFYQTALAGTVIESGFQSRGQFVIVNKIPQVSFTGLSGPVNPDDFCQTSTTYNLVGSLAANEFLVNKGSFTLSLNGAPPVASATGFSNTSSGNATFNPAAVVIGNSAVENAAVITYQFDSPSSGSTGQACRGTSERTITIKLPPDVNFDTPTPADATAFCFEDASASLSTDQATNILYQGYGVSNISGGAEGSFKPDEAFNLAGGGNTSRIIPITATYTSPEGCTNTISRNFQVYPKPFATFNPSVGDPNDLFFCFGDPEVTFNGSTLPEGSTSQFTIKFLGQTTADPDIVQVGTSLPFNPAAYYAQAVARGQNQLNDALFQITYEVTDNNNCTSSIQKTYTVSPEIDVQITGLIPGDSYCSNLPRTVTLSPFPDAAKRKLFFNNVLQPLSSSSFTIPVDPINGGAVELRYEITGGADCVTPETVVATALPSPVANFDISADALRCVDRPLAFDAIIGTNSADAIYTWTLQDEDLLGTNVEKTFTASGTYNTSLTVNYPPVSGVTCVDTEEKITLIGDNPLVTFNFANVCEGDATQFIAQFTQAPVQQYRWTFGNVVGGTTNFGNSASSIATAEPGSAVGGIYKEPIFTLPNGEHLVTVIAKTSNNCTDTLARRLVILPNIALSSTSIYDMGNTNGLWSTENLQEGDLMTWEFANPNGTRIGLADDLEAWVTNATGPYQANDVSAVNSPCFNLSDVTLSRPVISLDYWTDTREGLDGAVLQYSTDGGFNWKTLGTRESGLTWYNKSGIASNPSGPLNISDGAVGWSEEQPLSRNTWRVAKHTLEPIPETERTNVRFRIRFSSNGDEKTSLAGDGRLVDGFAFRNVKIENRNRTILVENFVNSSDGSFSTNQLRFNEFVSSGTTEELVGIQYNTSIGGTDALNRLNPSDPDARSAFYGVTQSLQGYLDGNTNGSFLNNAWAYNAVSLRSLVTSPMNITIGTPTVVNGKLLIDYSIDLITDVDQTKEYAIFVAVTEPNRTDGNNHLLRKLLPNATGVKLTRFNALESQAGSVEYDMLGIEDYDGDGLLEDLGVVVFVQELAGSKEVLQVKFSGGVTANAADLVTGLEDPADKVFSVFPNPADQELMITFPKALSEANTLLMYDQLGKLVTEAPVLKGEQRKRIATDNLANGIYLMKMNTPQGMVVKKIMISHRQ